ncbi:hypothetical protein C8Q74DRAFT_63958 [Fomes fomentarius]|nr:hypothetical protein C8Q74DRAFT_63958 [Fomes fomentarius]
MASPIEFLLWSHFPGVRTVVLSSVCSILRTAPGVPAKRGTSYIKDRVAAVAYPHDRGSRIREDGDSKEHLAQISHNATHLRVHGFISFLFCLPFAAVSSSQREGREVGVRHPDIHAARKRPAPAFEAQGSSRECNLDSGTPDSEARTRHPKLPRVTVAYRYYPSYYLSGRESDVNVHPTDQSTDLRSPHRPRYDVPVSESESKVRTAARVPCVRTPRGSEGSSDAVGRTASTSVTQTVDSV